MNALVPFDPTILWASKISAAWQKSVAAILEAGKLLVDARDELPRGTFQSMVRLKLPFDQRTAQRLMAIARHPILSKATHVSSLPSSWGTLYELAKLDDAVLAAGIEHGTIHPRMERRDVAKLRGGEREAAPKLKSDNTTVASTPALSASPFADFRGVDDEFNAVFARWQRSALVVIERAGKINARKINLAKAINLLGMVKRIHDVAAGMARANHLAQNTDAMRKAMTMELHAARGVGDLLIKFRKAGLWDEGRPAEGTQIGAQTGALRLKQFGILQRQSIEWRDFAGMTHAAFEALVRSQITKKAKRHERAKKTFAVPAAAASALRIAPQPHSTAHART